MHKWGPQDVIALVLIVGGLALRFSGIDGATGTGLIVVAGLYYGIDLTPFIKLGRNISKRGE
ncbi:hypothetical protein LCGC14_0915740 [marine sediment metagenome]|uniref:Uncharacterized protein n=1 Tax=marine sediment metagenome TaxID=412755 RepID=A0A0F9PD32_9ZZZZ